MNIKELLPIGSVVLLKTGTKRVMIVGVKQTDIATDTLYDYACVLYPEGHLGNNQNFLFNHEDIAEIFFRGFEDEERAGFIDKLDQFYQSK